MTAVEASFHPSRFSTLTRFNGLDRNMLLRTRKLIGTILRDRAGAYTVEFALVAPLFFTFLFGTFEIGIVLLRSLNLEAATQAGSEYVIRSAIQNKAPVQSELRNAIIADIPFATSRQNLKVSLARIDSFDLSGLSVTFPIQDRFDTSSNRNQTYVLSVGYDVYPILPWTAAIIPYRGTKPQIQSVILVSTAVKVTG